MAGPRFNSWPARPCLHRAHEWRGRAQALRRSLRMRSSPSIVPGVDRDVCLVLDDFGRLGLAWRETDVEDTGFETVVRDLLDGQYSSPVRVIAFNITEGWSRDVSEDVALELLV